MGSGAQATGNLTGWAPFNPDTAYLTGIVLPQGIRDPYVYNDFLSIQREIAPKTVMEIDYVGTVSHKLFRAQDINRQAGSLLPVGATITDNLGRYFVGARWSSEPTTTGSCATGRTPLTAPTMVCKRLCKHQMGHGLLFNASYTYSHSIDEGSTWHSGATTASGGAGGDGYSTDQALPGLDRGNSVFDIRHRLDAELRVPTARQEPSRVRRSGVWAAGSIAASGRCSLGLIGRRILQRLLTRRPSARTVTSTVHRRDVAAGNCTNIGGDYNLDGGKNDRPNSSIAQCEREPSHATFGQMAGAPARPDGILRGVCG